MTDLMQKALAAVNKWGAERQDEAAEMLLALDRLGRDAAPALTSSPPSPRPWTKCAAARPRSRRAFARFRK